MRNGNAEAFKLADGTRIHAEHRTIHGETVGNNRVYIATHKDGSRTQLGVGGLGGHDLYLGMGEEDKHEVHHLIARHNGAGVRSPGGPHGEFHHAVHADEWTEHHFSSLAHKQKLMGKEGKDFFFGDTGSDYLRGHPDELARVEKYPYHKKMLHSQVQSADRLMSHAMPLPEKVTVHRGMSFKPDDFGADHYAHLKAGDVTHEKAHLSTSLLPSVAEEFQHYRGQEAHHIRIRLPKGHHVLPLDVAAGWRNQREMVLHRGQKFRVISHKVDAHGVHQHVWEPVAKETSKGIGGAMPRLCFIFNYGESALV